VDGWICLERRFSPDHPGLQSQDFTVEVTALFEQFFPFYRFCAWTKANDYLSMAKVVSEEKKAKRRSGKSPFEENDSVTIVGGLFAGRTGVVAGYDRAGKVKVKVGNLTLPVSAGSLKLIQRQ
jgi:transcription antitermination factor NusG